MPYSSTEILYRELNASMYMASETGYQLEGSGDLSSNVRSGFDVLRFLRDVAHVQGLNYHILSLRAVADFLHVHRQS